MKPLTVAEIAELKKRFNGCHGIGQKLVLIFEGAVTPELRQEISRTMAALGVHEDEFVIEENIPETRCPV